MSLKDKVQDRIAEHEQQIFQELATGTNDPIQQWAALKVTYARILELDWIMQQEEIL